MLAAAPRLADIAPFHVMELLSRARELEAQGRDIVHMEVGEPDFPTPAPILAAAQDFLSRGQVQYTPALGLPQLREAIAGFYQSRYGVTVAPERIAVTAGASGALTLALACLATPGREWLVTDPGYPCNRHFIRAFEGVPVSIPVGPESDYQPPLADLERHWTSRTDGALFASPANPTGTLLSADQLRTMADFIRQRGGQFIVDEIYHGLTYGLDAPTALAQGEDIFVVQSFSKYFHMTGWRLGWLVMPPRFVRDVEKLAQNLFIAASTPAQYAALSAFQPETIAILEARREQFRLRRDALVPALQEAGFRLATQPQGAFYLYADCSAFTDDSFSFARNLLEEGGVAVTPGIDFGQHQAARHIRLAYTADRERLLEGVARIRRFLGR